MKIPVGQCKCGCGKTTKIAKKTIKMLGHVAGQPKPFAQSHWLKYRPVVGHRFCPRCKKYRKHDAFLLNKSKSPYCTECRREWTRNRYKENVVEERKKHNLRLLEIKRKAMAGYSKDGIPRCACCKETEIIFLSFDHINGDRRAHYEREGIQHGQQLHYWVIRNGFPEFLRVLCMNCNTSYGHRGYCPHDPPADMSTVVPPYRKRIY